MHIALHILKSLFLTKFPNNFTLTLTVFVAHFSMDVLGSFHNVGFAKRLVLKDGEAPTLLDVKANLKHISVLLISHLKHFTIQNRCYFNVEACLQKCPVLF